MKIGSISGYEVRVNGISMSFRNSDSEKVVLHDISFAVASGEVLAICGLSGVGKSTLLKLISGLSLPTAGQVQIDSVVVNGPHPGLGFVTQDYSRSLFPWLTVARNVALPFKALNVSQEEKAAKIKQVLISVGLEDSSHLFPWQLSGGMQQRVAIARALVTQPRLLLLDEPFASVDAHVRLELEDLIARLVDEHAVTTILVTHDIDEAIYMADRVITLSGSPAGIGMEFDVDLPRPREQIISRAEARFSQLRTDLYLGLRK